MGVSDALAAIAEATVTLDKREPTDPTERIERWQAAKAVVDDLYTVVKQMESDAVDAMVELGREFLETSLGPVYTDKGYAPEEWDGNALLGTLSVQLVDRDTGEVTDAVPTAVLRDVIPAVSPGKTSSKWSITGLRKHGIRVDSYHRKDDAPLVMRRGTPRR
jgi:hypothetical protein